jgi:hypothetical protein
MSFVPNTIEIDPALNFSHAFEGTKVADKKYVLNQDTGEYLGIVGHTFNCASHPEFFQSVWNTMTEHLPSHEMEGATLKWKSARYGTWGMLEVVLPNVTHKITTRSKHETEVAQRIISLHGIDGSCSNQVFFGAIDFFCTNGLIVGEYDKVKRKNTKNFDLKSFEKELYTKNIQFEKQMGRLQQMADTSLTGKYSVVESVVKSLMKERPAEKMLSLYKEEAATRGNNVFALFSAMTNYASYADERNGFQLKASANDNQAITMWNRQQTVSQWTSSKEWDYLMREAA